MRNPGKNGTEDLCAGTEASTPPGDSGMGSSGRSPQLAGDVRNDGQRHGQGRGISAGLPNSPSEKGRPERNILASIEADSQRGPEYDPIAGESWPNLQQCLACTFTKDNQKRAGGEVKTLAAGYNYRTTLVMPEEGVQVSVVHNALSKAWEALEHVLCLQPVPWVECSEFATRRAKHPQDKKKKG